MDLHNVTLSRELQVGFHLTLPKCSHVSSNTKYKKLRKAALFLQGMVEVVAENYHNIWAKKKKTELVSKGVQIVVKFYEQQSRCYLFVFKRKRLKWLFNLVQEEGPTHCWYPMIPWQLKRSTETERRPRSSSSSCRLVAMPSQGQPPNAHVLKKWKFRQLYSTLPVLYWKLGENPNEHFCYYGCLFPLLEKAFFGCVAVSKFSVIISKFTVSTLKFWLSESNCWVSWNFEIINQRFDSWLVVSSVSVSQRLEGHGAGFIINGKTLFLQVP